MATFARAVSPKSPSETTVLLLVLSGDVDRARAIVQKKYPAGIIKPVPRHSLENGNRLSTLAKLRRMRPDVFAIATERNAWQRRADALILTGALTGAREILLFDQHGDMRVSSPARSLIAAAYRLPRETLISATGLLRARKDLKRLATAIATKQATQSFKSSNHEGSPRFVYLRSSPGPGTQPGGAATHINGFLRAASDLGAHFSLISNDEIAGLANYNGSLKLVSPAAVGITRAACDIYNNLIFTSGAIKEIRGTSADFIYQRYARFSWAGVAAALEIRRPLFLEFNGSEVWIGRHWDHVGMLDTLGRIERLNLEAATRIFVVSEVERRNLLQAGIAEPKIVVNPNGVDVEKFQPGIGGDSARKDLGVAHDEILVGFVGTFGPWHGVEVLAKAIPRLASQPKIRFLLIGRGQLREEVEQLVNTNGCKGRTIMMGVLPHEKIPRMLDACDILVSPHVPLAADAEFFGSPTKLFEYMGMGKAIVASRLGQIAEVLRDGETALLVEPGAAEPLANAILRLSECPALRAELGSTARRAAVERHTWKRNAQRVLDEYYSLA